MTRGGSANQAQLNGRSNEERGHPGIGFVIDLDGVLIRGKDVIPGAVQGIEMLKRARIPFLIVTNGGGQTEKEKAISISKRVGTEFAACQVQVSHTPLKLCSDDVKEKLTLVLGPPNSRELMANYGFHDVITADELHALHPTMWPDEDPAPLGPEARARAARWRQAPVAAVCVVYTPQRWYRDLQIALDMVKSDGHHGTVAPGGGQGLPLYFAGPDLEYAAEAPAPRLGAGAFLRCLEHLFALTAAGGRPLRATVLGKPHAVTYECAEALLTEQALRTTGRPLRKIYAVGDNPASDVAGANAAGAHWTSVLVETGMFRRQANMDNDPVHPADLVCADFLAAVTQIVDQHCQRPGGPQATAAHHQSEEEEKSSTNDPTSSQEKGRTALLGCNNGSIDKSYRSAGSCSQQSLSSDDDSAASNIERTSSITSADDIALEDVARRNGEEDSACDDTTTTACEETEDDVDVNSKASGRPKREVMTREKKGAPTTANKTMVEKNHATIIC
ncbi:unnamed protein product [Heterosigma akashiwo]|mmetsp:Transcript_12364/g.20102  ORF Transcript_12364/g.20102 Transcript_12364/m.20102 type:complete len:504 (+) Transcript_12364:351-1862(+)